MDSARVVECREQDKYSLVLVMCNSVRISV